MSRCYPADLRLSAERYRGALRCVRSLAVEIVSPSESSTDLDDKIAAYLDNGTKTVWVIWPKRRHAMLYHSDSAAIHVRISEYLESPELIPGVRILLDRLFAQLGPG